MQDFEGEEEEEEGDDPLLIVHHECPLVKQKVNESTPLCSSSLCVFSMVNMVEQVHPTSIYMHSALC